MRGIASANVIKFLVAPVALFGRRKDLLATLNVRNEDLPMHVATSATNNKNY